MSTRIYSHKIDLINKAREAMLAAVQIYNNPLITFKTESFIVLSHIAWTYLLHSHYRTKGIDYRYYKKGKVRKRFERNTDGSFKYWDLSKCISNQHSPLDKNTKNNLRFLIGLRHQVEHRKAEGLDSFLSARYQACALNFNRYLKRFHGDKYGLDQNLALSLQFAQFDEPQSKTIKDKERLIPPEIFAYISDFDNQLSGAEVESERFAYRLLFTKVLAKRRGQADRVVEFIDPKSKLAKNLSSEYLINKEVEKPKLLASQVVAKIRRAGFKNFRMYEHTMFFKQHDGKNPDRGFGTEIAGKWYWYENWPPFIVSELQKEDMK